MAKTQEKSQQNCTKSWRRRVLEDPMSSDFERKLAFQGVIVCRSRDVIPMRLSFQGHVALLAGLHTDRMVEQFLQYVCVVRTRAERQGGSRACTFDVRDALAHRSDKSAQTGAVRDTSDDPQFQRALATMLADELRKQALKQGIAKRVVEWDPDFPFIVSVVV